MLLQDYIDVDRVLVRSRAQVIIDPSLFIQQPKDNDIAKVLPTVVLK